jgi:Protein of unknown function (DUF2637)
MTILNGVRTHTLGRIHRDGDTTSAWVELGALNGKEHASGQARVPDPDSKPGMYVIKIAAALLAMVAIGLLYVSFAAQYRYVLHERGQVSASVIEALAMDVIMIVLSLLAFGLARNGQKARTQRIGVMVFAFASAVMNFAAADDGSWRSVLAYSVPPLALAFVADQVVTTVRRHILHTRGEEEKSAWEGVGRGVRIVVLYTLRFAVAAPSTLTDARHRILAAAPCLEDQQAQRTLQAQVIHLTDALAVAEGPRAIEGQRDGETKRACIERLYAAHPEAWDRDRAAAVATELAKQIEMSPGTARNYVNDLIARHEKEAV